MPTGVFLSLDGIDGTGKSTQCRLLAEKLRERGHTVVECVDPGGTTAGQQIRELVLNGQELLSLRCEMFLFMASRAQLVEERIRPALDQGQLVVSDRFLLANVVYQGHAGGLDPQLLWQVGDVATGGLQPDLTLVLDLPVQTAAQRRKSIADRLESRSVNFHQRVREGFLNEALRRPDLIKVIDASADVLTVHQAISQEVTQFLGRRPET